MSWGTNEKGTNEMGDQWDGGPVSGSPCTMPLTRLVFALYFQNGVSPWRHFCFAYKYRQNEPQYQCGGSFNDIIAYLIKF